MAVKDDRYQRALERIKPRSPTLLTGACRLPAVHVDGRPAYLASPSAQTMAPGRYEAVEVDPAWQDDLQRAVAPLVAHDDVGFRISLGHLVVSPVDAPLDAMKPGKRSKRFGTLIVELIGPENETWTVHSSGISHAWAAGPLRWYAVFGFATPSVQHHGSRTGRRIALVYNLVAQRDGLPPTPVKNTDAVRAFQKLARTRRDEDPCVLYVRQGSGYNTSALDEDLVDIIAGSKKYDMVEAQTTVVKGSLIVTRATSFRRHLPKLLLNSLQGRVLTRWFGADPDDEAPLYVVLWPCTARWRLLSITNVLHALATNRGQLHGLLEGPRRSPKDALPLLVKVLVDTYDISPSIQAHLCRILLREPSKAALCLFIRNQFVPNDDSGRFFMDVLDVCGWLPTHDSVSVATAVLAMLRRCHKHLEHSVMMLVALTQVPVHGLVAHAECIQAAYNTCVDVLARHVETPQLKESSKFLASFLYLEQSVHASRSETEDSWFDRGLPPAEPTIIESFEARPAGLVDILLAKPALFAAHVLAPALAMLNFVPTNIDQAVRMMELDLHGTLRHVSSHTAASFLRALDIAGRLDTTASYLWADLGVVAIPVFAILLAQGGPIKNADAMAAMLRTTAGCCIVQIPHLDQVLGEMAAMWPNVHDLFPRFAHAAYDVALLQQHLLEEATIVFDSSGVVDGHIFASCVHSFLTTSPVAFPHLSCITQLARALTDHGVFHAGRAIAGAALTTVHAEMANWTCFLECSCAPCTGLRVFLNDAREGVFDIDDMDARHVRTSLTLLSSIHIVPHHVLRVHKLVFFPYTDLAIATLRQLRASASDLKDMVVGGHFAQADF
ncbi:hypothetical protein SDRG_12483 [Saprolegnia diclina VS20]|uniref:Uncharacterized protein n=1 Tax=Saprolegnia diclina (strain VS20) TaxID=1156394 RepID=T0Q519_SAPDV|nr:hypothetical protein SDRG_12483 [Saprolegnia diclina VS20]EQC29711.1 hypothetical protein SDRG_12483 [Saprolegnia diclina VS20]|eukprot:XP_008616777.1 hypothetical protein SDRG_12483 [Saprolegnia diclina VS20]